MRWKSHVRFGRRAAETERSRDRHRAAARPHTEHPTAEGKLYCCAIKDLLAVQAAVNSRPRKVFDWKTPAEVLDEQLRSLHQAGVATAG